MCLGAASSGTTSGQILNDPTTARPRRRIQTAVIVQTGRGLAQTLGQQAQPYSGYYVARNLRHAAMFIAHDRARRAGRPRFFAGVRLGLRAIQSV